MRVRIVYSLLMFMFCINIFFMPLTAYASTGDMQEILTVDAVWIEGEILQIDVTNINTGEKEKLELRLSDYTEDSEYISIQAVDLDGNKSNIVQIKNPYYKPPQTKEKLSADINNKSTESAVPSGEVPFSPAGNGEILDNAKESDGKEFFTIKTPNDNTFYLVIDRQRGNDNVYLLNTVTEADLLALAEKGDGKTVSVIPTQNTIPIEKTEQPTPPPEPEQPKLTTNTGIGTFVLIGFAMIIVGSVGYYFKIYKPKQDTMTNDSDSDFDESDDEEYLFEDDFSENQIYDDEHDKADLLEEE